MVEIIYLRCQILKFTLTTYIFTSEDSMQVAVQTYHHSKNEHTLLRGRIAVASDDKRVESLGTKI